jgi:hypothetical protein
MLKMDSGGPNAASNWRAVAVPTPGVSISRNQSDNSLRSSVVTADVSVD